VGVCTEVLVLEQAFEFKLIIFSFVNILTAVQLSTSNESLLHEVLKPFLFYVDRLGDVEIAIDSIFYLDTSYVVLADRILRQVRNF
jgi:hypothetical protein